MTELLLGSQATARPGDVTECEPPSCRELFKLDQLLAGKPDEGPTHVRHSGSEKPEVIELTRERFSMIRRPANSASPSGSDQ